jgi:hypothetical protein
VCKPTQPKPTQANPTLSPSPLLSCHAMQEQGMWKRPPCPLIDSLKCFLCLSAAATVVPITQSCAVRGKCSRVIRRVHLFQMTDSFRSTAGQAFRRAGIHAHSQTTCPLAVHRTNEKKTVDEPQPRSRKSCQHIMGTPKTLARTVSITPLSEEASGSDSDSDSEHSSQSDHKSDSDSDSDSLDSHASRKRRKIAPETVDAPLVPTTSVPSRINPRVQENGNNKQTSNGAILAPLDSTTTFSALNVKPWLVGALGAMAIKRPTGIQKGCIPEILKGRDCIGGSRTGSGKTVAFAVPILQKWAEDPFGIFALVLTPTRYDLY